MLEQLEAQPKIGDDLLTDLAMVRAIRDASVVDTLKADLKRHLANRNRLMGQTAVAGKEFRFSDLPKADQFAIENQARTESEIKHLQRLEQKAYEELSQEVLAAYNPPEGEPAIIHVRPHRVGWDVISSMGEIRRYEPLMVLSGKLDFINPGGQIVVTDQNGQEWFVKVFNRDGQQQVDLELDYPQSAS